MKIARETQVTGVTHYRDITGYSNVRSLLERAESALDVKGFGDEQEEIQYSGTLYRVTVTIQELT